jgi:isoleucyl-tRNA synthetase
LLENRQAYFILSFGFLVYKISEVKDRMFDLNETINWKPKATGEGRFGNWLKNANDWNLSRSRFWEFVTIWRTRTNKKKYIGSVEELL